MTWREQLHGGFKGRLVKVKLGMVVADSPARAKVGGIASRFYAGKSCPHCLFDLDNLGNAQAPAAEMRGKSHREQSLACLHREGAERHKEAGVRYSVLYELPYYSTPTMCPPDYMHAIHLGLCKRFFHVFLIDACGHIGKRLGAVQTVLKRTWLPSTAQKPDERIGKPGGGSVSAQQWLTLFRHQLIFALMEIWAPSLAGAESLKLHFEPQTSSVRREILVGDKAVEDVFEAAVLLIAIVDYMERDFVESDVGRLEELIKTFNRQQANLLGPGWLTYNSHIAEHIPEFIRRYGSRKYTFLPLSHASDDSEQ